MSKPQEPVQGSGLVQAAFTNNRERWASATPVSQNAQPQPQPQPHQHPTSAREFQNHLDEMSRNVSRNVSLTSFNGFASEDNNRPSHSHGHGRGMGSSSTNMSSTSIGSGAQLTQALSGLRITEETNLTQVTNLVNDFMNILDRAVHHNKSIAPSEQTRLLERSGQFRTQFSEVTRRLQQQIERQDSAAAATRDQLQDLMNRCARLLRERDEAIQRETIALTQSQVHQNSEKNLRIEIQRLTQQVASLQATASRNHRRQILPAESNITSTTPTIDHFVSARTGITTHAGDIPSSAGNLNTRISSNVPSPLRPSVLPPLMEIPTELASLRHRRQTLERAAPTSGHASNNNPNNVAMVLHATPESDDFAGEFNLLYMLVERYSKNYCSTPNPEVDKTIPPTNQKLWAYMMDLTYPNQTQDAHNHTKLLIEAKESRSYFIMRLILNYLFMEILSIKTWFGYSNETDRTFESVKESLSQRGLSNAARQQHIDREVRAVQSIMNADNFNLWLNVTKDNHCKNLRDYLGMLLNKEAHRPDAGKDLGAIVLRAWSLNVKMRLSHLTFQVIFPATAAKFNAATMVARDRKEITGMQLQLSQTRLKLVITPVVTLRDDRGPSIKVRNLHHALVLTMP